MAGVAAMQLAASHGPLSRMARAQYAALARMRLSILKNTVRTTRGALEMGAQGALMVMFALMGLGIALGLGAGAYGIVSRDQWDFFPILPWIVLLLWQALPVALASYQQQFDMSGLLRFPVSYGTFCVLHLIVGLVDASTVVGGLGCLGIWGGIVLARPELALWSAVSLALFAAFNVLLARAILAWIDRWLAQRRTREIVTALFFILILSANFLNPAFRQVKYRSPNSPEARAVRQSRQVKYATEIRLAGQVQRWLPPGLAARAMHDAERGSDVDATEVLGLAGLFMLGAGGVLGIRLRAEYRGENLGEAPSRKKVEKRTGQWLLDGSGPVAAVVEKEIRLLMRALPLLYALAVPMLMVFLFTGVYRNRGAGAGHVPLVMLLCLAYGLVGFTQLLYNNLGTEGAGVQFLFMSPTPIRTVVMAKNMFHTGLFAVEAALICAIAAWRYGMPAADTLAATVSWLLFAVPVHLAAGNIFSLTMPYRINMGRIGRQSGSQANAMLSLLIQVGVLGVGAGVFVLCSWLEKLWLAVPIFLLMATGAVFAWLRVLANVDRLANQRREELIGRLVKAE